MKPLITQPSTTSATSKEASRASEVYEYAFRSVQSFIDLFTAEKRRRGSKRGILPQAEQDLLRAALTFACAGLDSVLKHAIRDCITNILSRDIEVEKRFAEFIEKKISPSATGVTGLKFLSQILAKPDIWGALVDSYIGFLVGSSLQSEEEVFRVCAALGIDPKSIALKRGSHRHIFVVRNEVIHEMDIDLAARPGKRITRGQRDMLDAINLTLKLARDFVIAVDKKINA
jgi:hypothetical protein